VHTDLNALLNIQASRTESTRSLQLQNHLGAVSRMRSIYDLTAEYDFVGIWLPYGMLEGRCFQSRRSDRHYLSPHRVDVSSRRQCGRRFAEAKVLTIDRRRNNHDNHPCR